MLWISHFMTFAFGAFAGIMIAQVGWDNKAAPTAANPPAQSPPSVSPEAATAVAGRIQQLESHLSHSPEDLDSRIQLGNAYFDTDKFESAIIHYSKALEAQPRNADVIVDMGIAYRKIGRSDVAAQKFREALVINDHHVNARYNLGIVLKWDLDDIPGAVAAWDTLLLYTPNHPNAATLRLELAQMRQAGPRR